MTKNQTFRRGGKFAVRSTIGAKLIQTIVLTTGVALVLASIALITYNYFTTREQMTRDLTILSQVISDNSAASLMFENATAAADVMAALRAQPNISNACLYTSNGAFFADYHSVLGTRSGCPETAASPGLVSANGTLALTQAVVFDGEQVGFFLVRLRLAELGSQLFTFGVWVALIAAISLGISFILSAYFQRKITRPLLGLVGLAEAVTQKKDYTVRAVQESDDEIGHLIVAFNEMLTTVAERDQALTVAKNNAESKNAALQREIAIRRSVELERDQAVNSLTDAIESMSEGFAVWNSDDRLVMCNTNYRELFRELAEVLVEGVHFKDFLKAAVERGLYETDGLPLDKFIEKQTEEHRNPSGAVECLFGRDRWVQINKHRTETGGIVGTWTDVSERRRVENKVRELAHHDPLTGLANRTLFHSSLSDALSEAEELDRHAAILFIDLDRFKPINDEFGHVVGDKFLKIIAERLVGATRDGDVVARLGGDEFAVILRKIHRETVASELAQRIVETMAQPVDVNGSLMRTGASVGISVFPEHDTNVDELIRKADVALYQAKADGRGTFRIYDEGLHRQIRNQNKLEDQIRHAIDADEFTLFYQPQFDLEGERLTGVEALVRWQHPDRGLLLPGEFMPVAESSGLVLKIDEWVLREACHQGRKWRVAGLPEFRIAVNVSARQFRSDDLVSSVQSVLTDSEMNPDLLELEITEHMVMDDVDEASRRLSRLHDLGVRLAVDDFGTGHSSLSYLKKFPIWRLKIDRDFVRDIAVDSDDAAIIDAIIRLSRGLRLNVLAEGVETVEQVKALRRLGCDEVQGFLYAKPMPADRLADWLTDRLLRPTSEATKKPEIAKVDA